MMEQFDSVFVRREEKDQGRRGREDAEGFTPDKLPAKEYMDPFINPAEEMVDMVGASRAYQANLTAINLIRDLVSRSLELGRA